MQGVQEEPSFFQHQRTALTGEIVQFGIGERWCAPVSLYQTPSGFGVEAWIDAMPESVIAWRVDGAHVTGEWGRWKGKQITGEGRLTLQTAGTPNHSSCRSAVSFAQFVITEELLRHVGSQLKGGSGSLVQMREDLGSIEDPMLFNHLEAYRNRLDATPTRLEMEARAVLVVERLLSKHHDLKLAEDTPSLDWRLRRAIEYLEARLSDDVGLAELTELVGLSAGHVTTIFRIGTGETPHRWLMRRRFERACVMLRNPRTSVTEVALACGFASSQHLATVFRKRLGTTPTAWRRQLLA